VGVQPELAFADCPSREGRFELQTLHLMFRRRPNSEHQLANEGNRRDPSRAEPRANKLSPARMLLSARNSAPNSGRIPPRQALAAPAVRIPPLRQTVCTVCLQSGDGGKSARNAALAHVMRTGECELCARLGKFLGFFSQRRKAGSLHRFERNSLIYRLCKRAAILIDSDRLQLGRLF